METELNEGSGRRRVWLYTLAIAFLLFVLYYAVMSIIAVSEKVTAINSEFGYKPPENSTVPVNQKIFRDSAYVSLNRQKAFYQSRTIMAETDSISLSLNLPDSTASLEINGVAVHEAKLIKIFKSGVFNKADEYAISNMLSVPFNVTGSFATIKKEPLMLKVAPKDTSEYKPDILPDTTNTTPVNYIMQLDHGFRIYVYQDTGNDTGGILKRFIFDVSDRFRNIWGILKSIATFKVPEYHPAIKLRMKKDDARIIYRALPVHGQIALYR